MDAKLLESAQKAASLMADVQMDGYKYEHRCMTCTAVSDKTGKNIRPEVDAAFLNTQKLDEAAEVFRLHGLTPPSTRSLSRHMNEHSPYVKMGVDSKEIQKRISTAVAEHVSAQDALQEIVNEGMAMVRDGTMPITERLFSTALKEANKNHQISKFSELAKELDEKLFNRRTIKDEVTEKLENPVIDGEVVEED